MPQVNAVMVTGTEDVLVALLGGDDDHFVDPVVVRAPVAACATP